MGRVNFVFDIDGTTSFNGRVIETEICAAFRSLRAQGHTVVLASARPIRDILPMLPADLKDLTCVGANGALIYQNGSLKVRALIQQQAFERLRQLITEHGIDFVADSPHHYAYALPEGHFLIDRIDVDKLDTRLVLEDMPNALKIIMLNISDPHLLALLHREVQELTVEVAEHDDPHGANIDLTAAGVHKQSAVQEVLCCEPYIAFGNDTNDLEMLSGAAYSVAVGTKSQVVAQAHSRVDAHDHAVAQAILQLAQGVSCR